MSLYPITVYDSEPSAFFRFSGGDASFLTDSAGPNDLRGVNLSFVDGGLIDANKDESLSFNGSAYAYRDDPSGDIAPKLGQTLEVWLRSRAASDMTLISYASDADNGYVLRFKSDRRIQAMWKVDGVFHKGQTSAASLDLGSIYHVVASLSNDGVVSIYLNAQDQSLAAPGKLSGSVGKLVLGGLSESFELFNGDLDEVAIYDRALSLSDVESHYSSATGGESGLDCECPTITYPNGGERISDRNIAVAWQRPKYRHTLDMPVSYELFFTDSFRAGQPIDWMQIASVPSTAKSFLWKVPLSAKSRRCRVGIRCRDYRGFAGDMSYSAADFSILARSILPPSLVSPVSGGSYRVFVPIVFDNEGIRSSQSQRSFYDIYYSSESNDTDWTPVASRLPVTREPFLWDVRELPPGSDYSLRVSLSDEDENSSLTVFVRGIAVAPSPISYFYIDTEPPKGELSIDNNTGYVSTSDVTVRLSAFDETTDVSKVRIREKQIDENGSYEIVKTGPDEEMANVKSWILSPGDGVKYIEAIFMDSAGNIVDENNNKAFFRRYTDNRNDLVTAVLGDNSSSSFTLWTAFSDGLNFSVHKDRSAEVTLDGPATSLAVLNDLLYIGIRDSDGLGVLQSYDRGSLETIYSFSEHDSSISNMEAFGGVLYIAQDNGSLWSFDGSTVANVSTFPNRINRLFSDGVALFIFVDHEDVVRVYDGSSFITSEVINANQQI